MKLGHRRIAYIGGDPHLYRKQGEPTSYRLIEEQRMAGYLDTLKQQGLPIDEKLIALSEYYSLEDGGFAGDGALFAEQFLNEPNPPTAVFATCDILAAGVLQTLYRHDLRVPDDVSVVGYDGTYAPFLTPPLTTVQQPMLEIGGRAAQILIALQDESQSEAAGEWRRERLTTYLSVRSSTGPAPVRSAVTGTR